jgi:hypothetical protein
MSKPEFIELLEEHISNLEKDYDSIQKGNSNQPIFSLIQNTNQKLKDKYYYRSLGGKANSFDHSCPDNIDHQKTELSICCLAVYVNYNLTSEMWSINPTFAFIS